MLHQRTKLLSQRWALCLVQWLLALAVLAPRTATCIAQQPPANFQDVAAVLKKYCSGCHGEQDAEAGFSVSSYEALYKPLEEDRGPAIVAGKPDESVLYQLLSGADRPRMPPQDQPQPTSDDVALIARWIAQGAQPPAGDASSLSSMPSQAKAATMLVSPAERSNQHVTAVAAIGSRQLALGRWGRIEFVQVDSGEITTVIDQLPGKITSLRLSPDGQRLVVGAGQVGASGTVTLVGLSERKVLKTFADHADAVYCAALSPDGRWLASGSYDRTVVVRDMQSEQIVARLTGHNGAIYDLDFHPSSQHLATASADQTVKLWSIPSGQRLDTLGQPEGEMRCVRFAPNGQTLFAGGGDRQVRRWRIQSTTQPTINPLLDARFAHEKDVVAVQFIGSDLLVSASNDRTIKLWTADSLMPLGELARTLQVPIGLCSSGDGALQAVDLKGGVIEIARATLDQMLAEHARQMSHSRMPSASADMSSESAARTLPSVSAHVAQASQLTELTEVEPNDHVSSATDVSIPVKVLGVIDSPQADNQSADVDLFRFTAQRGQSWLIEVRAARDQSPLDSLIEVTDVHGQPVLNTRLQATRATYFTFRGKDSSTVDDFRLHKWEDMELDEYLYSEGETTRLWLYPRGPDSGFKVYPGSGSRHTFFGTTAVAHALGAPAYIVSPLAADDVPLPNGLPVFPVYFENDDDSQRELGADSRLMFTAPADGQYLLRVRDARGFGGPQYRYQVSILRPQPDFRLSFSQLKIKTPRGSGREWSASVKRIDGLNDAIAIWLHDLPEGVLATNPLIIEAGQQLALGTIFVQPDAILSEATLEIPLTARTISATELNTASITDDRGLPLPEKLELAIQDAQEVRISVLSNSPESVQRPVQEVDRLIIRPGQTISARVRIDRQGFAGPVSFGREDSGRNLPHGAFVDNIGLNGLLIPEEQIERELFITAAPKVKPGLRQFHFRTETSGNPTSRPIWLEVVQ
ncbi:MAG: hypothetical protein KF752_02695 [Pirellulaceae bacterium]|nr:hypothetical protein [Pirellulaceae bacterium]